MSEVNGEMEDVPVVLSVDNIGKARWVTQDGRVVLVRDMEDRHLRNIALFLMDLGYSSCIATREKRILWLKVLCIEWKRRMLKRKNDEMVVKVYGEG